jgi:hypothetical protein
LGLKAGQKFTANHFAADDEADVLVCVLLKLLVCHAGCFGFAALRSL